MSALAVCIGHKLAESEARAVTGGTQQIKNLKNRMFLKLRLKQQTGGELRIFRGIAFQICGAM